MHRMLSHFLFLLLLCGAAVLPSCAVVSASTIVDYTVTSVLSSDLPHLPSDHWAQYITRCTLGNNVRTIPLVDSLNRNFVNISGTGMRVPFYAWNSTPFHVSNMGFLSPTWYGMCDGMCTNDFFATLQGNYGFSDNASVYYDGGGDWPMISFYLAPFQTSGVDPGRSFILTQEHFSFVADSSASGTTAKLTDTLVEYCDVPLEGVPVSAGGLTAQVEVHADGAVVMRYRSLPAEAAVPGQVRSTGLIYSKTLRKVVPTPTAANGIAAYRFDPVYDACDGVPTASACAAMRGASGGGDCVWCPSTSACASRAFVAEVCPRGQWAMDAAEAGAGAQRFYNVTVDNMGTVGFADLDTLSVAESTRILNEQFVIRRALRLFNTTAELYPICGPGFSCPTQNTSYACTTVQNTCVNGAYDFGVLALESTFAFDIHAVFTQAALGRRRKGGFLCDADEGCAAATVGQLFGIGYKNGYTTYPDFSVQFYEDAAGVIDLIVRCNRCPDGAPFLAYPPIRVGLSRYGVDDFSSVLVPQGLLRSGVHIRFVPQTTCGDCGLHGSCNEATGTCGCMAGHYGGSCRACPACWRGSVCDDGVGGSGACVCDGGACAATCSAETDVAKDAGAVELGGAAAVPERSCVGCSAVGGRCDCGACVCVDGWSGADCDVPPEDGCRAYSLDGCAVCGEQPGCVFCFDSTCYNASLSGTASGYVCSYSTPAANTRACRTYGSLSALPSGARDGSAAVLGCILAIMALELIIAAGIIAFSCKTRHVTDPASFFAVGSTVGLTEPPRDREVIQVSFARQKAPGVTLIAIPLKQVSLKRLFNRRKEALEEQ